MQAKKKKEPAYVSSMSQQTAEKMLDEKLRKEGFTGGRSDANAPEFKLFQDKKTGEYRFRKVSEKSSPKFKEGGKVKAKKDACYHKVKARYKVWPSAYASGALVRCRKVGAKNWGNKSKG